MSMFANQNVYPTRDNSGLGTIDHTSKMTAQYTQKQPNDKTDKEKSFIKLFSKKDTSMITKN